MTQWYVKELSELTQISVQTLHHYDRIGLLKPSVRLANGYRLYSEKDLLKLQQIIALKFFGFELSQIKNLLSAEIDMIEHFSAQSQCLEEKAKMLFEASQTLKNIVSDCGRNKSFHWENIIKSIEVYRMTQQLEKTWAGKVFTPAELKEYASFEQELKTRFTEKEKKALEQIWENLVKEVEANLDQDPTSNFGLMMGKQCMDWVNTYYGKKYVALRNAIWLKGFKNGQIEDENALSQDGFAWLDEAITAYYSERIFNVLSHAETKPYPVAIKEWEDLLTEMHGDEQAQKDELFNAILKKEKFGHGVKNWLKKYLREHKS